MLTRCALLLTLAGLATAAQADAQLAGGHYSGAIKFLRLVLQSAALGLAAWLAVKGDITPGSIIAASVLLSRAVAPVELVVGVWPSLVQAVASWKTLTDLFAGTAFYTAPEILTSTVGRRSLLIVVVDCCC